MTVSGDDDDDVFTKSQFDHSSRPKTGFPECLFVLFWDLLAQRVFPEKLSVCSVECQPCLSRNDALQQRFSNFCFIEVANRQNQEHKFCESRNPSLSKAQEFSICGGRMEASEVLIHLSRCQAILSITPSAGVWSGFSRTHLGSLSLVNRLPSAHKKLTQSGEQTNILTWT